MKQDEWHGVWLRDPKFVWRFIPGGPYYGAERLEITNGELSKQFGIQRLWLSECPYCESSHPVTAHPYQSPDELVLVGECVRHGGLMKIRLEGEADDA